MSQLPDETISALERAADLVKRQPFIAINPADADLFHQRPHLDVKVVESEIVPCGTAYLINEWMLAVGGDPE